MRILDKIESPKDVRRLDRRQLPQLAQEIRDTIIDTVSTVGGHFGGNLGIVGGAAGCGLPRRWRTRSMRGNLLARRSMYWKKSRRPVRRYSAATM